MSVDFTSHGQYNKNRLNVRHRLSISPALISAILLCYSTQSFADSALVVDAINYDPSVWSGTNNVSQGLQGAINAVSAAGGGTVDIPQGQWDIGTSITLQSNVTLTGSGSGTTLIATPNNSSNPLILNAYQAQNVLVEDMTINGGGINFQTNSPVITVTSSNNVIFDNITVTDTRGIGLLIQGGTSNSGVTNSTFTNVGNYWQVSGSASNRSQGLVFCCGTGNNNNFATNNTFSKIGLDALQISNQNNFTAANNTFLLANKEITTLPASNYGAGIFAENDTNVIIKNNIINGAQGNGIDAPGLQNAIIANNTITNSGAAGIGLFIAPNGMQTSNIKILNNVIENNVLWNYSSFTGGITVSGGTPNDIYLAGNTITNTLGSTSQTFAIQVLNNTEVDNFEFGPRNVIAGTTATPVDLAGLWTCPKGYCISDSLLTPTTLHQIETTAVPELSTWMMMLVGFLGLAFFGQRGRHPNQRPNASRERMSHSFPAATSNC